MCCWSNENLKTKNNILFHVQKNKSSSTNVNSKKEKPLLAYPSIQSASICRKYIHFYSTMSEINGRLLSFKNMQSFVAINKKGFKINKGFQISLEDFIKLLSCLSCMICLNWKSLGTISCFCQYSLSIFDGAQF